MCAEVNAGQHDALLLGPRQNLKNDSWGIDRAIASGSDCSAGPNDHAHAHPPTMIPPQQTCEQTAYQQWGQSGHCVTQTN
eukprot:m.199402 g.199402  ORF g.199402 m.199402 type:complete len:80 (-) comp25170_c1_seq4:118-357(-)